MMMTVDEIKLIGIFFVVLFIIQIICIIKKVFFDVSIDNYLSDMFEHSFLEFLLLFFLVELGLKALISLMPILTFLVLKNWINIYGRINIENLDIYKIGIIFTYLVIFL